MTVRVSSLAEGLRNTDVVPTLLVTAPEIVEFWRENLRSQFNTRFGIQAVAEKSTSLVHSFFYAD